MPCGPCHGKNPFAFGTHVIKSGCCCPVRKFRCHCFVPRKCVPRRCCPRPRCPPRRCIEKCQNAKKRCCPSTACAAPFVFPESNFPCDPSTQVPNFFWQKLEIPFGKACGCASAWDHDHGDWVKAQWVLENDPSDCFSPTDAVFDNIEEQAGADIQKSTTKVIDKISKGGDCCQTKWKVKLELQDPSSQWFELVCVQGENDCVTTSLTEAVLGQEFEQEFCFKPCQVVVLLGQCVAASEEP